MKKETVRTVYCQTDFVEQHFVLSKKLYINEIQHFKTNRT